MSQMIVVVKYGLWALHGFTNQAPVTPHVSSDPLHSWFLLDNSNLMKISDTGVINVTGVLDLLFKFLQLEDVTLKHFIYGLQVPNLPNQLINKL